MPSLFIMHSSQTWDEMVIGLAVRMVWLPRTFCSLNRINHYKKEEGDVKRNEVAKNHRIGEQEGALRNHVIRTPFQQFLFHGLSDD